MFGSLVPWVDDILHSEPGMVKIHHFRPVLMEEVIFVIKKILPQVKSLT